MLVGRAAHTAAAAVPKAADPGDALIERLAITFTTGSEGTDGDPYVVLRFMNGTSDRVEQIETNESSDEWRLGHPGHGDFEAGTIETYGLHSAAPFRWKDLRGFVVGLDGGDDWGIAHLKLRGFTAAGQEIGLYDAAYGQILPDDTQTIELLTARPVAPPPPPPIETFVAAADLQLLALLVRHIEAHAHHYERALWLGEDPNDRAVRFEQLSLDTDPLLGVIENRAVEIAGDWVAFPVAAGAEKRVLRTFAWEGDRTTTPLDTFVEQLLTLPSRGVFAEARLGHCNASEQKDDTRFWDWQTSPIPHHAPGIEAVSTGSRALDPQGLTPTPFPQSLVNIVNPQSLPDPTGLAAALEVLGTPEIFRNMSASKEVGELLQKLSDNATAMASQGMQGGARQDLLRDIRGAEELSPQKRAQLVEDLLAKEVAGQEASVAGEALPGIGTGTGATSGNSGGAATGTTPASDTSTVATPAPPPPPPPPRPTPQVPVKPRAPDPSPATRGLRFHLNFQRAQVGTTATGTADVTIRPFANGAGMSTQGYVPGVTPGVPTPAQMQLLPESWWNQTFLDGALFLQTEHAVAPGQIPITVSYDLQIVAQPDLIAGVNIADSAEPRIDRTTGRFTMNHSTSYKAPAQGNTVVLRIVPKWLPLTLTVESSEELGSELASKVGAKAILEAEVSASQTLSSGTKKSRTFSLVYLTGGLDVNQET